MEEDQRAARLREAQRLEDEAAEKYLWWMSFVDPSIVVPKADRRPGGPSFLGVCIVEAASAVGAMLVSHEKGINPGGEIETTGPFPMATWAQEWRDRLLSWDEVHAIPVNDGAGGG